MFLLRNSCVNIKMIDLNLPIPSGAYILKIIADDRLLNPIKLIKK